MKKSELKALIQEVVSESLIDAMEWERTAKSAKAAAGAIKSKWSVQRLAEINKQMKILEAEKAVFENPTPQGLLKWARANSNEVERLVNSPKWRNENPQLTSLFDKSLGEGEEEKLGGAAYDREDSIERGQKARCKKCGKQFVPSYGEHSRCPTCLSKEHGHGERATGVQ